MASGIGNDANSLIPAVEDTMLQGKLIVVLVPEKCLSLLLGDNRGVFYEHFQFVLGVTDDSDRHEIESH